ncbi:hypothetical protein BGAL_0200g00130 [Botrytis galanthina]|uniref:Uncharacterized protein n=1 Tax=Botrytis galanthina TaxID=278940 RepID=A0A4S8R053_9HELO|nr:hypothetical protein BGAL_0200g00130 [Botrytis galanthina]
MSVDSLLLLPMTSLGIQMCENLKIHLKYGRVEEMDSASQRGAMLAPSKGKTAVRAENRGDIFKDQSAVETINIRQSFWLEGLPHLSVFDDLHSSRSFGA